MPNRNLILCFQTDLQAQLPRMIENSTARPTSADLLRDLVTGRVEAALKTAGEGTFVRHGHGSFGFGNGEYAITSIFRVLDFDRAESVVRHVIDVPELRDKVDTYHWFDGEDGTIDNPTIGSIEIYYSTRDIPSGFANAIEFRDAACALIETALTEAEIGKWVGSESGEDEVNFGFEVGDIQSAERLVRRAVAGSPFEKIRAIIRFPFQDDVAAE